MASYDLTNQVFSDLTVIEKAGRRRAPSGTTFTLWLCKCNICGEYTQVITHDLLSGHSKRCKKCAMRMTAKHGATKTRLYNVWRSMRQRCSNTNAFNYYLYGGRGIRVCDEWQNSFEAFRDWCYANGYKEDSGRNDCTLDRIDVNGNYEPNNCRIVNMQAQANNKRTSRRIEYNGEIHTVAEWAKINNVPAYIYRSRLQYGWDIKSMFEIPVNTRGKYKKRDDAEL